VHEQLLRDLTSLIHPQHDLTVQRAGRVWVRGVGAMLVDADGKEYIDGLAGSGMSSSVMAGVSLRRRP
jgi:adenosylmethionine-8-amino-7-oxononanoate aminotransferase